MDTLYDFLNWAWARHHNPLSWYIRPFFVLPYCFFAYKRSKLGIALTIVAVLSSMFWFPAPEEVDPRAKAFLDVERRYATGSWTLTKAAMTALVPLWFTVLAWAFWRRSWIAGALVVNVGVVLKVLWSFYFAQDAAWSIVPAVGIGLLVCNGILLYAYRRLHPKPQAG